MITFLIVLGIILLILAVLVNVGSKLLPIIIGLSLLIGAGKLIISFYKFVIGKFSELNDDIRRDKKALAGTYKIACPFPKECEKTGYENYSRKDYEWAVKYMQAHREEYIDTIYYYSHGEYFCEGDEGYQFCVRDYSLGHRDVEKIYVWERRDPETGVYKQIKGEPPKEYLYADQLVSSYKSYSPAKVIEMNKKALEEKRRRIEELKLDILKCRFLRLLLFSVIAASLCLIFYIIYKICGAV